MPFMCPSSQLSHERGNKQSHPASTSGMPLQQRECPHLRSCSMHGCNHECVEHAPAVKAEQSKTTD